MPEFGPVLAGHHQGAGLAGIGDAIEHVRVNQPGWIRVEPRQIDPGVHRPGFRREAHQVIGLPDIGVEVAVNVFEFVEEADLAIGIVDGDVSPGLETVGIDEEDRR